MIGITKEMIIYIMKRWYILFISMFMCGLLLGRANIKENTEGAVYAGAVVTFPNHKMNSNRTYSNYLSIYTRSAYMSEFCDSIEQKFEMQHFAPDWNNYTKDQKMQWIRTNLESSWIIDTNSYEFGIAMSKENDDFLYICDHAEELLSDYCEYAIEAVQKEVGVKFGESKIYNTKIGITKNEPKLDVNKKYIIIGVILGGLLGGFCILVTFFTSKRIHSKEFVGMYADMLEENASIEYRILCYIMRQIENTGKRIAIICSTNYDNSIAEELMTIGKKGNLNIGCIQLQKDSLNNEKEIADNIKMPIDKIQPGRFMKALKEIEKKYDVVIVNSECPVIDPIILEVCSIASCAIMKEELDISYKMPLIDSLKQLEEAGCNKRVVIWRTK